MKGEKGCAICGKMHEIFYKFPEDFPDEFKLCCGCLASARNIIKDGLEFASMMFNSYRLNKIYKLITLNG